MTRSVETIIDDASYRPAHWVVIIIAAAGLMFDGFDYQATAYAAPLVRVEWHLDPKSLGGLISAGFVGLFFGSIIASYIADRIGRKKAFALCALIFGVFTAAATFAPDFNTFVAMRLLTGLGLGGLIPIAVVWLMEFLPAHRRLTIVAAVVSCFVGGWIVASLAALLIIPSFGWRAFFILGSAPALLAILLVLWGPESPRWLMIRRRYAEALSVLQRIDPSASLETPPAAELRKPQPVNWLTLFSARHIRSTIIIALMYFMVATVSAGITQWLPTLMIDRGISLRASFMYSFFVSAGPLVGTVTMGALLESWGRRVTFMVFWCVGSCFIALFAFARSPALVMFLGFGLSFTALATFTCLDIIAAEIYPTNLRSSAVGFGMGISRLGGVFGPILGGYLVSAHISYAGFFLVFAIPPLINACLAGILRFGGGGGTVVAPLVPSDMPTA